MPNKSVYVLFKTHLDIGFTDYSATIVSNYLHAFIPAAIRVGNALKGTNTPFIWTVGSWMIDRALKADDTGAVAKAIEDGILNWHALPFTTHTELMSPTLFRMGQDISAKLDKRFSKHTIAAKLTDVPGHTIGIVPLLARAGVQFLHIGVNPATPVPPTPPLFRWKLGEDEILVMVQGDYGQAADFGDFAVVFAHTGDNLGPQNAEEIVRIYEEIAQQHPGCDIVAATLDDVARRVLEMRDTLPVMTDEIGDTWIHGAGTDPGKLSRFRAAQRELDARPALPDLTDSLLCVPEHTWGMDVKTHFPDDKHYTHREMANLPAERAKIERSWEEQRAYMTRAESLLGLTPEAAAEPDLTGCEPCALPTSPAFTLSWQIFDNADYARYRRDYMRLFVHWSQWDFTKVGLPDYQGGVYDARIIESYEKDGEKLHKLAFDPAIADEYGLPYFWASEKQGKLTIQWFGKQPDRRPQACWLKFHGMEENWQLHKMGQWLDPTKVVGSPLIHAVLDGVRNDSVQITPLDSALVCPFGKRLLQYTFEPLAQDMHFLLYNNIWNTNFPMWYSDDALFRFAILPR